MAGGGGFGGGSGGMVRRRPSPTQMIMNNFNFKGIDPHVAEGMKDDVYTLARKRSSTGIVKPSNVSTIRYIVDTKYAHLKGIDALRMYLYEKLTIPVIKLLCKRYISQVKNVSDEFALNQEKQWRNEALMQPGYAVKLDELRRTREETLQSLFEYVVLKYDKDDVDWYHKQYGSNPENGVFIWERDYMDYLNGVKLFGKKKTFQQYVEKNKKV